MVKSKSTKNKNGAATPPPKTQIELSLANAPILSAKYLELILMELRKLNSHMDKIEGDNG
jgi:hypothetical protein